MVQDQYPFVYFGEGCSYFEKKFACCIWFKNEITREDQKIVLEGNPFPGGIFHLAAAGPEALFFQGEEDYEFTIKEKFNPEFTKLLLLEKEGKSPFNIWADEKNFMPSADEWIQFDRAITEWLLEVHKKFPIAFVFKPAKIFKKAEQNIYGQYGSWHEWSVEKLNEEALARIQNFYAEPKDAALNEPALHERVNWLTAKILDENLKKLKGKSKKTLDEKRKFLGFAELLCTHDNIFALNPYDGHEEILFRNGETLDHLIKDFPRVVQREIISSLTPYTQLVLFSAAESFPYVLLFEEPAKYVRTLLDKIDPAKQNIFSSCVALIMTSIRLYWQDRKPEETNKDTLLELADLVVSLPGFQIDNFMKAEFVFQKYGVWEKVLQLYTHNNFLLRFSDPAEQLLEVIVKIPSDQKELINTYIPKIAENVKNCQLDSKELGFQHNYAEIAQKILSLML